MLTRSLQSQIAGLLGWLLLTFAAAALGGWASVEASGFYLQLQRPTWAPPPWLFGPVWAVLYAMMAVAVWLVWRQPRHISHATVYALYVAQLVANALWTWLFFVWQRGALAFVEVIVLWLLILATTVAFWRRKPLAGALLLPYLAWVGFATALTWAVWQANPGKL